VLCALGAASPVRRDPSLTTGLRNIIDAMSRGGGPSRLVYLSFLGVSGGRRQLSLLGRTLVAQVLLRNVTADHMAKEELIMKSGLAWTIVRPPRLTNGPHTGTYRHGSDITARSIVPTLSRADLADFMLRQLDNDRYLHRAAAIMT
jgi:hypothetical protein